MHPLTQSKNTTILPLLIALALGCLALAPQAGAVCQEGCDTSSNNTFLGDDALVNNTDGNDNTAVGAQALHSNIHGSNNTAIGFDALFSATEGQHNTAIGVSALESNLNGFDNTATGASALKSNDGWSNTATGVNALFSNTGGYENTATGVSTLLQNTSGHDNTATGLFALGGNTTGFYNTANGAGTLAFNTTGTFNTANGYQAHYSNTTGKNNTADGNSALFGNTTGSFNIALGNNAGFNLTTGINNIDIGNPGVAGESKTIRIGRQGLQIATYIGAISGATVPTGVAVIIDASGHLGTTTSSARYKEAIQSMDKVSEAILSLKPVTFRYKHELDPEDTPQFGLVAEEVEKVNPALVARDEQGKPYTVRYDAVNAMLLNEFLKEHRKVQELEAQAAQQQKQIKALTAGLQKVSAQLELSKAAPQTVLNKQ